MTTEERQKAAEVIQILIELFYINALEGIGFPEKFNEYSEGGQKLLVMEAKATVERNRWFFEQSGYTEEAINSLHDKAEENIKNLKTKHIKLT